VFKDADGERVRRAFAAAGVPEIEKAEGEAS
jgi:hypothetical protein